MENADVKEHLLPVRDISARWPNESVAFILDRIRRLDRHAALLDAPDGRLLD
jgi:hypothetical protein